MAIQNHIRRLLGIEKSIECVSEKTATCRLGNFSLAVILLCFLPVGTATAATKVMSLGDSLCAGNIAALRSAVAHTKFGSTIDWVGTKKDGAYTDPDNECHGGWSAAQALQQPKSNVRLPSWEKNPGSIRDWVQATKPDVVLIMLGTNDFFGSDARGDNTSDFLTKSLQGIIDDILLLRPNAKVVIASIPPFKWDIQKGVDTSQTKTTANAFLKHRVTKLSAQGKQIFFLDMHSSILARNKQGDIFSSDGLHFNAQGNSFIAQEWTRALKAVLQGAQTPIIPTTSKNY
jgi:GDSL-like Lipase/Acylhydrolase family